jgi:hypothetical protein
MSIAEHVEAIGIDKVRPFSDKLPKRPPNARCFVRCHRQQNQARGLEVNLFKLSQSPRLSPTYQTEILTPPFLPSFSWTLDTSRHAQHFSTTQEIIREACKGVYSLIYILLP